MDAPQSPPASSVPMHFGHIFLTRLYGLAWRLARPILRRNKRLADGFERRLVPNDWAKPCDVWLQAASGGEAYLLWETLAALPPLPEGRSPLRILATTWTRQGLEVLHGMAATLKKSRPDLAIHITLFPLDHPALMYKALKMAEPKVVVLLETELWPGLLFACKRKHIPVLVLNGRLSAKSARNYRLMNSLAPDFWRAVGPIAVSAMSETDATRYRSLLPAERVSVAPNIKFDRALSQTPQPADIAPLAALLPSSSPILLLASVREQEERHLSLLTKALAAAHPEVLIIVAPRHLHRVDPWIDALAGRSVRLRSGLTPKLPARAGQIVIWNRFGELSTLYALASHVFIGGSLAPLGGQNFLEALTCGRIPHTGPHLSNFAWALDSNATAQTALPSPTSPTSQTSPTSAPDSLPGHKLIRISPDAESLYEALHTALTTPPEAPETVRARFAAWLNARKGGATKSAILLHNVLFPSTPSE